ncbi:MFS transporter, PAT family, beta-lactamase induction signal transducer AmpG [Marinospirillum celere]|uniref:MFS transporter, PAT family, beta-lactamase induction signal transducer AmpG n=1 Tax=Marinospirillum celere TaxID=1122252 RepID=A0A1I1FUV1_9GAMM|nr:MFS transporter [Marinospirillum celere]SFC02822.1 MFS transporter, PAT family, beta-lactamase induction signal transducer AmpG [Marinospirillum celere]
MTLVSFRDRLAAWVEPYRDRRMLTLLALGFSSGLPAPLVFSNLSIWLRDVGVSRTDIGLFALAATPYAINFLWAPLIDRLRLPYLSARFGRRRGWALFTQMLLMLAIALLAMTDPEANLHLVALGVLFVTFVSATQDIVIDAYRIEILEPHQYGSGTAAAIWGWHLGGTLIGAAGGLYLAHQFGWNLAYLVLAFGVLVGMLAVLSSPEPKRPPPAETLAEESRALAHLERWRELPSLMRRFLGWFYVTLIAPFAEFTRRKGWIWILAFIFVFKLGDALLGRMSGVFYREMGFSLTDIAEVAKIYGFTANIIGIILGGVLVARIGLLKALFLSGLATAATNLTYSWLAVSGQSWLVFVLAVASDNFTTGLVTVAFVAYLSSLCNSAYTATQYALLASLGNLARIWLSASSGWMVDSLGGDWALFFVMTAVIALIGLPLLWVLMKYFPAPLQVRQAQFREAQPVESSANQGGSG